jgi:predicted DsbA family dithiol-disulfide isomerase
MARAAYAFAMVNPNIAASVVEIEEFPELAHQYRVMGVPKTIINDMAEFTGAVPEEVFIGAIAQALGQGPTSEEPESEGAKGPSSGV